MPHFKCAFVVCDDALQSDDISGFSQGHFIVEGPDAQASTLDNKSSNMIFLSCSLLLQQTARFFRNTASRLLEFIPLESSMVFYFIRTPGKRIRLKAGRTDLGEISEDDLLHGIKKCAEELISLARERLPVSDVGRSDLEASFEAFAALCEKRRPTDL